MFRKGNQEQYITKDNIRRNKQVFDNMKKALDSLGMDVQTAFSKIDSNPDSKISWDEMRKMLEKMRIKMTTDEFEAFFQSIDLDGSGEISYPEFKLEYDRQTSTPVENLLALHDNKMKAKSMSMTGSFTQAPPSGTSWIGTEEVKQNTKIAILEAKEKQLTRRLEMY